VVQEIAMTYIPASDAAVYKTSAITRLTAEQRVRAQQQQQPASFTRSEQAAVAASSTIEKANNGTKTVISIGRAAKGRRRTRKPNVDR
jgi:hypothetical protein